MKRTTCKHCKELLNEKDNFGYDELGYCSLSCMLKNLDERVKELEYKE